MNKRQRANLKSLRGQSNPWVVKSALRNKNVLERASQFPRLVEAERNNDDKQLRKEFSVYTDMANGYFDITGGIATYLRTVLNNQTVIRSVKNYNPESEGHLTGIVLGSKKPELVYEKAVIEAAKNSSRGGRFIKIEKDKVILNLNPIFFNVAFTFTSDVVKNLEHNLKLLFSKEVDLPEKYEKNKDNAYKATLKDLPNVTTGMQSLEYYSRIKFERDPHPGYYQPEKLNVGKFPKQINNATKVEIILTKANLLNDYGLEPEGSVKDERVVLTFKVIGTVSFPLEYALWVTSATSLKNFIPKMLRDHFDHQIVNSIFDPKNKQDIIKSMNIGTVKKINARRVEEFNIVSKPRVNKEGFAILSNGTPIYVPNDDNVDNYLTTMRDSYNQETGEVKSNSEIKDIKNITLCADWINDAIAYTDTSGNQSGLSLAGAIALDDVTIAKYLNQPLSYMFGNKEYLNQFAKIGETVCREYNLYDTTLPNSAIIAKDYTGLVTYLTINYVDIPYRQLVKADPDDVNTNDAILISEFVRLSKAIAQHLMSFKEIAIINRLPLMFKYYLTGIYCNKAQEYHEIRKNSLEQNAIVPLSDVPDKFTVHNLPGLKEVLSSQAQVVAQSIKNPKLMIGDIEVGGGKTLISIIDIIQQKMAGKIKVAVIICPAGLVKSWIDEINTFSKGKINAYPITTLVVKKLNKDLGYDKKSFIRYCQNAPPNTIFIVSMNFLKLRTDHFTGQTYKSNMQFGEVMVPFFPNMQLLRAINADFIAIDESHNLRNETADVTKAVKSYIPTAEYKRTLSGTIVYNTPADMASQTALLNPSIYGTKRNFIANYGDESADPDKFTAFRPGGEIDATNAMRPYVTRVVKSKRDWSHLLPNLNINFVTGVMTPNQQSFYNRIIDESISGLLENPKIKALIEKGDEDIEAKVMTGLSKALNIVDDFVNAPDSNLAFMNSDGQETTDDKGRIIDKIKLSPDDYTSVKVKMVDGLLDEHFITRRDPHKVIVFCYNRKVSRHIFTHSRYNKIAVHYALAGGLVADKKGNIVEGATMPPDKAYLFFRQNPNVKVIIADETSLKEGYNLQIADEIIRVQTLWPPGAQEQATGRVMRPDVRNVYNRTDAHYHWLMCENSFEVAKAARLISKIITKQRIRESDNPKWIAFTKNKALPYLPPIKMNLNFIDQFRWTGVEGKNAGISDAMIPYFEAYRDLNDWEKLQFSESQAELRRATAKKLGIPESQVNLRTDTSTKVETSGELPGSKPIFTPYVGGITNPLDHRGLNLKALAIAVSKKQQKQLNDEGEDLENEDDNENDNESDDDENGKIEKQVEYDVGDLVQTEYGFGYIVGEAINSELRESLGVKVRIPGFNNGNPITISKQVVFLPVPVEALEGDENSIKQAKLWQAAHKQLKLDMKKAGNKGITFMNGMRPPGVTVTEKTSTMDNSSVKPSVKPPKIVPQTKPEDEEEIDLDEALEKKPKDRLAPKPKNSDKKHQIDLDFTLINGMPAIMGYGDEEMFERVIAHDRSWNKVDKFYDVHVQTFKGAKALINMLEQHFIFTAKLDAKGNPIPGTNMGDRILAIARKLKGGSSNNPDVLKVHQSAQNLNPYEFTKIEHTRPQAKNGNRVGIKLYPTIWNDELWVSVPIKVQQKQARQFYNMFRASHSGIGKAEEYDDMVIKTFKTVSAAQKYLIKFNEKFKITDYHAVMSKINHPQTKRLVGL